MADDLGGGASYDPETGELVEPEEFEGCRQCVIYLAQLSGLKGDLEYLQKEYLKQGRIITALKAELKRQRIESPEMVIAKAIFRYWVARLSKDKKRTKFGKKRQEAVINRLKDGYEPSYICRAIDGLAEFAYTNSKGVKFDDLDLVCRDEVKLERYYKLAEKQQVDTLLNDEWYRQFEPKLRKGEW